MEKKILLIEDDPLIIAVIKKILEPAYAVTAFSQGNKALHRFKEESFDLVITDIIMPEVEGMEIIMTIKDISPDTPIMAISGGGKIEAERYLMLARDMEVSCTIKKPFRNKELYEAVENILN
ncbi:MAG: response regulator [Fibrobacterota bacterium]